MSENSNNYGYVNPNYARVYDNYYDGVFSKSFYIGNRCYRAEKKTSGYLLTDECGREIDMFAEMPSIDTIKKIDQRIESFHNSFSVEKKFEIAKDTLESLNGTKEFLQEVYTQLVFSGINDKPLFQDIQKMMKTTQDAIASAKRLYKAYKPEEKKEKKEAKKEDKK